MERAVALKKLEKLLGKKLGWRINPKAPTHDERAAAKAAVPSAIEARKGLEAQRDARREAVLAADEEYQTLLSAAKAARESAEHLLSTTRHYKITVGTLETGFFLVKTEVDSWEEVIEKLSAKTVAA